LYITYRNFNPHLAVPLVALSNSTDLVASECLSAIEAA
jgi:hypothetical protein